MEYLKIDPLAEVCHPKKIVVVLGGKEIRTRIRHLGRYRTRPVVCLKIIPEKTVAQADLDTAEARERLVQRALEDFRSDVFNKAYADSVYTAVISICNDGEYVGRVIQTVPFGLGVCFFDILHTPFRSIVLIMQHMKVNSNCYNEDKRICHEGRRLRCRTM